MANWVYNTDHSNFLLPKTKINSAADALWIYIAENESVFHFAQGFDAEEKSFEKAMEHLGLAYTENEEGDVVDIYLEDSSWDDDKDNVLEEVIAPYVRAGSYLVFWGGGVDGVWGMAYEKNQQEDMVEGRDCGFDTVIYEDVDRILDALKGTNRALYLEMKQKYRPKHGE